MDNQYGVAERRMARLLSRFPRIKAWAKSRYAQAAYYLAGRHDVPYEAKRPIRDIGSPGASTFFGYYDKSPLSTDGWLLCHSTVLPTDRPVRPQDSVNVQVFNFSTRQFVRPVMSVPTQSFNWQQGARAHWLDGDQFIFNDFDASAQRYISRVYSVSRRCETRRYDHPVQDSWRREYFLALNYRRLYALRPEYGYSNLPALDEAGVARLHDDGLWYVDQHSGQSRLLYSLRDICDTDPSPDFAHARHKINHVMIGPGGRQFAFLHRYLLGRRKFDRLMLAQADGSGLRMVCANGMVSHCTWVDDFTLLCFLRGPDGHDGYYLVDLHTDTLQPLLGGLLDAMGDGHPSTHGHHFITDCYPDRRRMQHLLLGDLRTGKVEPLGRFHHGFRYGGQARCDLHPRFCPQGRYVFLDSVCSGRRRLYFLELSAEEES